MRIAARFAAAVLATLLLLPAAANATIIPPQPSSGQPRSIAAAQQAGAGGVPLLTGQDGGELTLPLKKRRKPRFQTRFFGE